VGCRSSADAGCRSSAGVGCRSSSAGVGSGLSKFKSPKDTLEPEPEAEATESNDVALGLGEGLKASGIGILENKSGRGIIIGSDTRRCRCTVTVMPCRGLRGSERMKGFARMLSMVLLLALTARLVCTRADSLGLGSGNRTALRKQGEEDLALLFRDEDDGFVTVTYGARVEEAEGR